MIYEVSIEENIEIYEKAKVNGLLFNQFINRDTSNNFSVKFPSSFRW